MRCEIIGSSTTFEITLTKDELDRFVQACDAMMAVTTKSKDISAYKHNDALQDFKNNLILAINS